MEQATIWLRKSTGAQAARGVQKNLLLDDDPLGELLGARPPSGRQTRSFLGGHEVRASRTYRTTASCWARIRQAYTCFLPTDPLLAVDPRDRGIHWDPLDPSNPLTRFPGGWKS